VRLLVVSFLCCAAVPQAFAQGPQVKVPVEAVEVTAGPLSERVTAIGSLISNEAVIVRPEVAGRIAEIGFEEGQPVKKGVLLIRLDDSLNRAEITETEARLDLARRNFTRTEELFSNRIASERSRDEARSALDVSTAALELAKVRLAKMSILAPFDGIAGLRKVSIGDYVNDGQDMVNLENIDPIKVDFRIAEKFLPALRQNQVIQVGVDAYPDRSFEGTVYAIDPRIDAAGRSIVIRARVSNKEGLLRPGLFARVNIILELKPDALTVPEQAIMPRGDSQFVFQVNGDKVKQKQVKIGTRRDGRVEIIEGLAQGDVVVTAGHQKIRDGAAVVIKEEPKASTDGGTEGQKPGNTSGKGA
jgi:membrane fusion protein, multidrug efflux system